jgi:tRNA-specific 2-thiouridylase
MTKSIAVAMSGGLDSSVTAWLLAQQETPVIGLSMLLWDRSDEEIHGRCCGALELSDAQRVAGACGISHYTLRMEEEFRRQVVQPFVQDYLDGRTPIPCTGCNTWIKFDLFLEKACELGADRMATGHYARILEGPDGLELHTSLHPEKDQSYYLFELTQAQLERSMFPLGELSKDEVRNLARQAGLTVAEKGESMEICFVKSGIREFVEEELAQFPEHYQNAQPAEASSVVDNQGRELGQGEPYYRYTVGQRRGLGVSAAERLYVLKVDPAENRVVVGGKDQLKATGLLGERLHWIGPQTEDSIEAVVKIRSRHAGVRATIRSRQGNRAEIDFAEPQIGVTPGQAAVFYQGSQVLGGCWISGAK